MARVLRNSRGQFQGSTTGWGRGNRNAAGPNTGRSGIRTNRSPRGYARQQRRLRAIKAGGAIGVTVGGSIVGAAMSYKGAKSGSLAKSLVGLAATAAGQAGLVATKRTLRKR